MYDIGALFMNASRRVRLGDGSYYRIRPVSATDRHLLVECFERLSFDSRRLRFFAAKPRLSEADLDFFSSADGNDHIALVAVRLNAWGKEQEALGFARCIRLPPDCGSAEISLAVADDVQRLGVGSALLDQLTRVARSAGIRHFLFEMLAENIGMRALAKRMGAVCRWQGDGAVEYSWPLPDDLPMHGALWKADPREQLGRSVSFWWTLIEKAVSIGLDYYDAMARLFPGAPSYGRSPRPEYSVP